MARIIKNQNVTESNHDNLLKERAIKLRWERNLYRGLERGRIAKENLTKVERALEIRTGKAW